MAADRVEQDIGVEEARGGHAPRSCTSSRDNRVVAVKLPIRSRNARSSRLRRSTLLSPAANWARKPLTSAETDVSCSAAFMRARRYVSSSTDTVIFFIIPQYHITVS